MTMTLSLEWKLNSVPTKIYFKQNWLEITPYNKTSHKVFTIVLFNNNDNLKNDILMSENIRQQILTILEYFNAYISHHYQPKNDNDDKYMHQNILEFSVFVV